MNRLGNGSSFLSQNLLALGLVCELHSQKLTWPLNMGLAKRTVVFQPSIFRCCVTFREGIPELKLSIFEFLTPTMHNLGMAVTALLWEFWKNEWDSWNYFPFLSQQWWSHVVPMWVHGKKTFRDFRRRTRGQGASVGRAVGQFGRDESQALGNRQKHGQKTHHFCLKGRLSVEMVSFWRCIWTKDPWYSDTCLVTAFYLFLRFL